MQAMKQEYLMGENKMSQSVLYTTGDDDMAFNHNSSVVRIIPSPKPSSLDSEPQIFNIQMQPEQHSHQPSDFADMQNLEEMRFTVEFAREQQQDDPYLAN